MTAYHHPQILPETTIWTNDPKGVIDMGRTEGGPHAETVDLRKVADSVLKRAARVDTTIAGMALGAVLLPTR